MLLTVEIGNTTIHLGTFTGSGDRTMLPRYYPSAHHLLLEPGVRTGVPLLVDNPKEVGTDRVANCLAAYANFGGPTIVVACGTATVVDAVSAKGEFLGGAIAPGINLGVEALSEHTVTVRKVELRPPRSVVGKNTVEALQGMAERLLEAVERGMWAEPSRETLDGLRRVHERSKSDPRARR